MHVAWGGWHWQTPLVHARPLQQSAALPHEPPALLQHAPVVQLAYAPQQSSDDRHEACGTPHPVTHACPEHVEPLAHEAHAPPPLPHAVIFVPGWHCPPAQHPLAHDAASHTQLPFTHARPAAQLPVLHVPPHPSSPPHVFPAQLGVHPHTPAVPPPPQVSGDAHAFPAQHVCPFAPHAPQLVPHTWLAPHVAQTTPPCPHAPFDVPVWQVFPLQQPAHDEAVSQTHTPVLHRRPALQLPAMQVPPHPSLAPQALPAQLGVHPQTSGVPPPPQLSGDAQVPPVQHF